MGRPIPPDIKNYYNATRVNTQYSNDAGLDETKQTAKLETVFYKAACRLGSGCVLVSSK